MSTKGPRCSLLKDTDCVYCYVFVFVLKPCK